jgi:hypothetical protein
MVTPEQQSGARKVYRSTGAALAYAGGGVLFAAVMVLFAALSWGEFDVLAGAGFGLALAIWSALRVARCGVYVEDGGVRVLNPLSTVRLGWSEIARFELKAYGACTLKRVHGRSVAIFGIQQTAWAAQRGKADTLEARMIVELNALLDAERATLPNAVRGRRL